MPISTNNGIDSVLLRLTFVLLYLTFVLLR
jgi:hypothetical protein